MIGRLRGIVVEKTLHQLVLDVGGVGYAVLVPERFAADCLLESEVVLYTYLQVREDALTLYGFASTDDKALFELLVGVSGVGPKLGLAILSTYQAGQIRQAIAEQQAPFFSAVSGIGKKNAERIILELKGKVGGGQGTTSVVDGSAEISEALAALGYSPAEVATAVQQIDRNATLDGQIIQGLKLLSK